MPQSGAGPKIRIRVARCLVKEYLRLWPSDGRAECVRVLHPSDLRAALAQGVAPRTSLVPGRFREAGRLEPSGTLRIGKQKFAVEVSEEPAVSQALWVAAARGVPRRGGRRDRPGRVPGGRDRRLGDRAGTVRHRGRTRGSRGKWQVYVEAVPAPLAPSWPPPIEGKVGRGVCAPAEPETLAALGPLIADATSSWARSPLDVVLTFGKQPDGPWVPDETLE